jgi:hypothetical protein
MNETKRKEKVGWENSTSLTEVFFTLITASFNPFYSFLLQVGKFILIKNLLSEHWRRFPNWKTCSLSDGEFELNENYV